MVNYKLLKLLYFRIYITKYIKTLNWIKIMCSTKEIVNKNILFYETEHCINKQYIVSGDQYYVPNSKLSASSVHSSALDVIYSRLTNEHDYNAGWCSAVKNDVQFIQVSFIVFSFSRPCMWWSFVYLLMLPKMYVQCQQIVLVSFRARYWTALLHMANKVMCVFWCAECTDTNKHVFLRTKTHLR